MANFTLTPDADTVVGSTVDDTIIATAATLNAGDSLTGGAGTDVLTLVGGGNFRFDQLANFTGFERIRLAYASGASLTLGNQPIEIDATGLTINVGSPLNWNGSNIINGDASNIISLNFQNNQEQPPVTYDLTSNTLSHVWIIASGDNVTLLINNDVTAGVQWFYSFDGSNTELATAGSTLDLSHSPVSGFSITSTNALGTAFTVGDLGTAFQIAGGSGHDTIVATGFTFSADQRNAVFIATSIEKIIDGSGTYAATPQNPDVFTLTTGSDTVTGTASNDTVNGTEATLNSGDSLTGGAGLDTLVLNGGGTFRVDQLTTFTGFESIRLGAVGYQSTNLYLDNQSVAVIGPGLFPNEGGDRGQNAVRVHLGSGAVTCVGTNFVYSTSASSWNAHNSIDGGAIYLNTNYSDGAYDLTTNSLSNINYLFFLYGNSENLTVQINSAVAVGISNFWASPVAGNPPIVRNAKLMTSDAVLDLSHSTLHGFTVASSNATGTNFTVHDIDTAYQVAGGSGADTITAQGFAFSAAQRNAIFAASSIEQIIDQSGTYTVNIVPTGANDAPVNTVPGSQTLDANTILAIAGLAVSDADAGTSAITTILSVAHGTLTVASAGGAAVAGSGTAVVTLIGTVTQINTTLAAANNVVYAGQHDFFGADTLTVTTNDGGHTGSGGPLTDVDQVAITVGSLQTGTPGNDSFTALPGNERIEAGAGTDMVTFGFRLVDATVSYVGDTIVVDGPGGSHTLLTGFEVFNFTDGIVRNDDGSPLVDDLYYHSKYHDVWNAHVDADTHYNASGWHEGRDPNAFFSTSGFLAANRDVAVAGVNPLDRYHEVGWREGRDPGPNFDTKFYLMHNPDVAAAGVDPLAHFLQFGRLEGRAYHDAIGKPVNGFDAQYYVEHNLDVAAAGVDPLAHFNSSGWHEGRNPNAMFDTKGYLAHYSDVAAAGVNPLAHYEQSGWKEGRDPSAHFDTTGYLAANTDVAAAHVNPLDHYLTNGIYEGRAVIDDGLWG